MLEQTDRTINVVFAATFGPEGGVRSFDAIEAIKVDGDGSVIARMNDRWHIVSGVEGRD